MGQNMPIRCWLRSHLFKNKQINIKTFQIWCRIILNNEYTLGIGIKELVYKNKFSSLHFPLLAPLHQLTVCKKNILSFISTLFFLSTYCIPPWPWGREGSRQNSWWEGRSSARPCRYRGYWTGPGTSPWWYCTWGINEYQIYKCQSEQSKNLHRIFVNRR